MGGGWRILPGTSILLNVVLPCTHTPACKHSHPRWGQPTHPPTCVAGGPHAVVLQAGAACKRQVTGGKKDRWPPFQVGACRTRAWAPTRLPAPPPYPCP